jgi:hypothetical protein
MRLRGKSTTMSHGTPVYYVDITTRDGMSLEEAITEAKSLHESRQAVGFDQAALEEAARQGFGNGAFEETEEELPEVLEEFFPEGGVEVAGKDNKPTLKEKLDSKAS